MPNTVLFELWIISLSLPDGVSCSCCKSDTRCLSTLFVCLFQVSVYGWIWPFMQDNLQSLCDISVTWLERKLTSKLRALTSGSARSSPQQSSSASAVLLTLNRPVWVRPYSAWGPWSQIYRSPSSSQPLHTLQRTVPARARGHWSVRPKGPHHPEKAEEESSAPRIWNSVC